MKSGRRGEKAVSGKAIITNHEEKCPGRQEQNFTKRRRESLNRFGDACMDPRAHTYHWWSEIPETGQNAPCDKLIYPHPK